MGAVFNPFTGFLDLTGAAGGGGTITGVTDTNSVDLTVSGTNILADVKLSAVAAGANNQLVNLDIQVDGIRAQIPNSNVQAAALNLQGPVTLTNNSSGTAFSYTAASNPFTIVEYSIQRGTNLRCGRLLVVSDGASVAIAESGYVELSAIGIALGASISVGIVDITYTATNTGTNGSFKYSLKQWS